MLALAQPADGGGVGRVAHEVEPAEALDRQDPAVGQQRRIAGEAGSAVVAADGLGVVTATRRVVVLGGAGGTHGEARHRGVRTVVGKPFDDREARSAVGARDERVTKAAIVGVTELGETLGAHRSVGRDERHRHGIGATLGDHEPRTGGDPRVLVAHDRLDRRERRRLGDEPPGELVERRRRARRLDEHARTVVPDETVAPEFVREPVNEGPEPHALHHPGHEDPFHQTSHTITRLLPESAMASRPAWRQMP